jgi:ElaB/YqjD/DUF883 family membrane-anchored ribosome-binding protein
MRNAAASVLNAGSQFAKIGYEAKQHMKSALTRVAQDKVTAATRAVRKSCYAVSDFVDEVAVNIKRHPLKSTAITFGVALGAGALAGWFSKRK